MLEIHELFVPPHSDVWRNTIIRLLMHEDSCARRRRRSCAARARSSPARPLSLPLATLQSVEEQRVPVDPDASRAWTEVAQGSRLLWHTFANVPAPAAGSNFARARELYPFEPVDERARTYVGAALEHMLLWADHTAPFKFHPEQETNLQQRPPFTLARAAMEAAAQAVWMLDTTDPVECIRRHISLIRWDISEHKKSKTELAEKAQVDARDKELLERVSPVFTEEQVKPPGGYLWVLRQACRPDDMTLNADEVERLWRAASGSAHGMYWPTQDLQQLVEVSTPDGRVRTIRVPDTQQITEVLQAAYRMVQYAVLKYASFAGADIYKLIEESRLWLASKVTFREGASAEVLEHLSRQVGHQD